MTAPLEPSRGQGWLPDTPEGEQALQVFISEDEALEAALATEGCTEPGVYEMTEQPSWWTEEQYGPWEPGFIFSCLSAGIVYPTVPLGVAALSDLLFPEDWTIVPPG